MDVPRKRNVLKWILHRAGNQSRRLKSSIAVAECHGDSLMEVHLIFNRDREIGYAISVQITDGGVIRIVKGFSPQLEIGLTRKGSIALAQEDSYTSVGV